MKADIGTRADIVRASVVLLVWMIPLTALFTANLAAFSSWQATLGIVLYIAVGIALAVAAAIVVVRRGKRQAEHEARFAAEPWKYRPDWAAMRAESRKQWTPRAALLASVFTLSVGCFFGFAGYKAGEAAGFASAFVCIVAAVWMGTSARRFGQGDLRLDTLPFIPGGQLSGVIHLQSKAPIAGELRLLLECIRAVEGDSPNEIVWRDERRIRPDEIAPGPPGWLYIPVRFSIPQDAVATTPNASTLYTTVGSIAWYLRVKPVRWSLAGNYSDWFELPVFAASTPLATPGRDSSSQGAGRQLAVF